MANDLWRTPPSVIEYVEARWGEIGVDLCADKDNCIVDNYLSADNSMLDLDGQREEINIGDKIAWCNPPYSNPLPFVKQCAELASRDLTIIMLLNMDTSTKWFDVIDKIALSIHPIVGGRIAFYNEDWQPIKGNNKPQVLVRFGGFGSQRWETIHINELQPKV